TRNGTDSHGRAWNRNSDYASSDSSGWGSSDQRRACSQGGPTHRTNSKRISTLGQPVNAHSIVVEQLFLIDFACPLRDCLQRLYPLPVAGRKRADGPITAKHNAVPPEAADRMIDERPKVFRRPALRICIGDKTGNLAGNVRKLGHLGNVRTPRVEIPLLHLRYPAVVKNENHIRAAGDQFDRDGKLASQNTDIE